MFVIVDMRGHCLLRVHESITPDRSSEQEKESSRLQKEKNPSPKHPSFVVSITCQTHSFREKIPQRKRTNARMPRCIDDNSPHFHFCAGAPPDRAGRSKLDYYCLYTNYATKT